MLPSAKFSGFQLFHARRASSQHKFSSGEQLLLRPLMLGPQVRQLFLLLREPFQQRTPRELAILLQLKRELLLQLLLEFVRAPW